MKPSDLLLVLEKVKFRVPLPPGVSSTTLLPKLIRTKDVKQLQDGNAQPTKPKLTKCLNTLDLTSLGIGSCCGTGMYLVAGMVAQRMAGPGVIISFIIAAIASIFSGACYAEFGVRVPHTSGSAYMYSYVAVGEFVAFIIGWNMILEYLIGTSACACALSSSFDSLTGNAIANAMSESIGTIFGKPPDFIAFGITLIMTCVLAMGASKSVIFNHTLNAINLATWVFVMAAGFFYVDTKTWSEHQGFLPYGWSGVFSGAATCFYAFIGFDIIATTGEEAHNPQKSIPKAIVGSLIVVLIAYVTVSLVLTLVVPYDHINVGAALVQMWSYVNAPKCRAVVAIGATAGLSVAMFGSMFPMPRVIYAMAQDGLIFRQLSHLWQRTNVPGLATIGSGLAAALVALTVRLDILVEMMSIGTLLAYTLVSTCVLVLRYQPHSTSLVELLPAQLRTPLAPGTATSDPHSRPSEVLEPNKLTIKRVTRGMSDSDDSFIDDSPEGYLGGRDDQFLVSDRSENKFYGSVHGAPTGPTGQATAFDTMGLNFITRKIHSYAYLCPGFFPWINPGQATSESGMYVTKLVGIMFGLIFFLDLFAAIGWSGGLAVFIYIILFIGIFVILLIISRQPQNRYALAFLTPGLPFIPAIAITVNIYLIFKLSILTLIRFTVWMSIGFIMYFYYGITHSSLEQTSDELELHVDKDYSKNVDEKAVWDQQSYNQTHEPVWASKEVKQPTKQRYSYSKTTTSTAGSRNATATAGAGNKSGKSSEGDARATPPAGAAGRGTTASNSSGRTLEHQYTGQFSMFVDEGQFPTWDD
ncbi:probable cationic amino acid transporter [Drosophila nasuta]|uniref:Probable cationic amino acid transporter isoform X1 n=1 Tax=Drosophila albomicans TaxID=7291 RepID=A0A6P8XJ78_DROAB|nr:probable cationic amino acid transporter isoform X1 [Drosophila albomicans]XP_051858261.1 probable cationic amino acid transporter isoform X1 [Drosophila albomicans]XP_060663034.1 probable cationic amino acid transporter [Drosophila nasuta]XP_060663035.1 probable cationic amino acid transporter [Drosophila nasuta]